MEIPPSSELDQSRVHIRKAFNHLKTHAAAVASFTLQWQDLEDYLNSIQNSIKSASFHLPNPNPTNPNPNPSPKQPPAESSRLLPLLRDREALRGALAAAEDPAALVLSAIESLLAEGGPPAMKSCVFLLEELGGARQEISAGAREVAVRVAAAWRKEVAADANSTAVLGFLMLLDCFGLVGEFGRDEIVGLFGSVAQRKPAVELFRSLGFSDKACDFIQNLISQKKNTEALRFIYAFEMVDKFAPIPLLQEHVKEAKILAKATLKNPKSTPKEKDDATNVELTALRSVIKCIEEYNLEPEYPSANLKERIELLKKQKKERKAKENLAKQKKPTGSIPQSRRLSGNKRPFSDTNRNNHHRVVGPTAAAAAPMPMIYSRGPTTGPRHLLHYPPLGMLENGERMEYLIPSSSMAIPSPNTSHISARSMHHQRSLGSLDGEARQYLYSTEASHYHQPSGSFPSPRTQYSPRYYNLDRSALETHSLAGSPPQRTGLSSAREAYNLTGYAPETQRATTTGHYGLMGSDSEHIDSLVERYQISVRSGQFGSSRAQPSEIPSNESPRGSQAYYPVGVANHSERLISSSGNYEMRVTNHSERLGSSSGNYDMMSNSSYAYHK